MFKRHPVDAQINVKFHYKNYIFLLNRRLKYYLTFEVVTNSRIEQQILKFRVFIHTKDFSVH